MLRLIAGLGNVGQQYSQHRHNYGFMLLDRLADNAGVRWQARFGGLYAGWETREGVKVIGLKPQEMMNLSGNAIGKFARYYDIAPRDVLVAYDELDLPLGKVRIKFGGGAAGHNGVRDTIRHLGGNFHRLRLGIGHPGDKNLVHQHVLSNFRQHERTIVETVIAEATHHLGLLLAEEFSSFLNHVQLNEKPS